MEKKILVYITQSSINSLKICFSIKYCYDDAKEFIFLEFRVRVTDLVLSLQ